MTNVFIINSPENQTDMLPKQPVGLVCPSCGMVTNHRYVNPEYRAPKRARDISHTYDGFFIGSERFKNFIASEGYEGIEFLDLPASPGFYSVLLRKVISINKPPELQCEEFCEVCRRYVSVYGLANVSLRMQAEGLEEGIYRSDIEMGYRLMMFPLWVATTSVKDKIKAAHLTGFSFEPMRVVVVEAPQSTDEVSKSKL